MTFSNANLSCSRTENVGKQLGEANSSRTTAGPGLHNQGKTRNQNVNYGSRKIRNEENRKPSATVTQQGRF